MLATKFDTGVPEHIADLFITTGEVEVLEEDSHDPSKLVNFLFGDPSYHAVLMATNSCSPISFKKGRMIRLHDSKALLEFLNG